MNRRESIKRACIGIVGFLTGGLFTKYIYGGVTSWGAEVFEKTFGKSTDLKFGGTNWEKEVKPPLWLYQSEKGLKLRIYNPFDNPNEFTLNFCVLRNGKSEVISTHEMKPIRRIDDECS